MLYLSIKWMMMMIWSMMRDWTGDLKTIKYVCICPMFISCIFVHVYLPHDFILQ